MISDMNYDQNPFRHFTGMSHELRFTKKVLKNLCEIVYELMT